jgi:hypothetical protein
MIFVPEQTRKLKDPGTRERVRRLAVPKQDNRKLNY